MGIGLYAVYELVRLHSGTVTVVSEEGVGSTFTTIATIARQNISPRSLDALQVRLPLVMLAHLLPFIATLNHKMRSGYVLAARSPEGKQNKEI